MTAEEWEQKWGSLPQEPQEPLDSEIERELKDSVDAWVRFRQRRSIDLALENKALKALCARAADALQASIPLVGAEDATDKLIAELREVNEMRA
jgi:hypothetical protein